ncbi:MAG: P-II family nitrogen regulator [Nitrospiria bacterium]
MIRAVIRPEREGAVLCKLESAGIYAVTKMPVLGRGRQRGVAVGRISYDVLSKVMLLIVIDEGEYEKAVEAIETGAGTGYPGDGKIFVQDVSEAYSVRTGMKVGGGE